jgi:cytochrome P450
MCLRQASPGGAESKVGFEVVPFDDMTLSYRHVRVYADRSLAGPELTAGLLDDLAAHGSPADLHRALALPLPIQVICELLGVPYADRDQFRAWSEAVGDSRDRAVLSKGSSLPTEW